MSSRDYYLKNRDAIIAKSKKWYLENKEKKSKYDKKRGELTEVRKKKNASIEAWRQKNPEKRKAHSAVSNAIRDGRFFREPCEVCGNKRSHAHHDDYSKPFEVRWLCYEHHKLFHSISFGGRK